MNKLTNFFKTFYNYISLTENILEDELIDNKLSKYDYIDIM